MNIVRHGSFLTRLIKRRRSSATKHNTTAIPSGTGGKSGQFASTIPSHPTPSRRLSHA
jgi:hypothetical protein